MSQHNYSTVKGGDRGKKRFEAQETVRVGRTTGNLVVTSSSSSTLRNACERERVSDDVRRENN